MIYIGQLSSGMVKLAYNHFLIKAVRVLPSLSKLVIPPLLHQLEKKLDEILYPATEPFQQGHFKVSELHQIWVAQYGNPNGIPVVFLHGGPGMGYGQRDMRFFNPQRYRIILLDQRGAQRSLPFGEMKENNTHELIGDLEKLRNHLGIQKWLIFGGSWGSTLSLAYGQAHPDSCLGFIVRGIFLGSDEEYRQLWYGMQDTYPEVWDEFVHFLPEEERQDVMEAYHKRIENPDSRIHEPAALAFSKYDFMASFALPDPASLAMISELLKDQKAVAGCSQTLVHYGKNQFFLKENQLLNEISRISHLPAIIVQGRFDTVCRAKSAYLLHKAWPGSKLVLVQDGGHSASEPSMANALVEATREFELIAR